MKSLLQTIRPLELATIHSSVGGHPSCSRRLLSLWSFARVPARDRIDDADLMRQEIAAWEEERNAKQAKLHWTFTISATRVKLKRLYPSNQG